MEFYIYSWITVTILVCEVKNEPKSGPFRLVTRSLGMCDDGGTNEVFFGKKMSSKGNGVFLYTDDVVFKIPWDDKLKADAEVQQLKNGAYVPKFVTQSFKNCQSMWKLSKDLVQSFFGAAGYNFTKCPLPAGPYRLLTRRIDMCDDGGSNEVYFGKKMSSKGNGVFLYTDDVVLKIPWDDKIKVDGEIQQLKNGAYVPKFVTQSFKTCQNVWKLSKDLLQSFFGAADYNFTKCPLPVGTYSVKDWPVDLKFNVPTFIYGSYKLIVIFSKDKKRVGCFVTYGEVVPRNSSEL